MSDINILNKLKDILDINLKDIKLEKSSDEGEFELVNPSVYIGWIPPKNYLDEYGYDIPGIVIMEKKGKEDVEEASLQIRLGIQTYDDGTTIKDGKVNPNMKGYSDILNLITKIRMILNKNPAEIGLSINKPIEWGFYDEQNYPFWTGYMEFGVNMTPLPQIIDFL